MSWKPAQKPSRLPSWLPNWAKKLIVFFFKWGIIGLAFLFAISLYYLYLAMQFDLKGVVKIPERSVIIDRSGEEFAVIHGERRRLINRSEISDTLVNALLAREDAKFYKHYGVDVKGLARATLRNLKDRSFTQGASTLSMQLTRNSYELRAKSLHRKFLEIALTLRLEHYYTKDDILTHYLNRVYFGSGCHGVEEAAQTYFNRAAIDLNTAESALLIGIIRGPNIFSPFRNLERAKDQRDEVLDRMLACGFLDQEGFERAHQEPIRLLTKEEREKKRGGTSYMKELLRYKLNRILDENDIRHGGLKIYATVDTKLQNVCETALKEPLIGIGDESLVQAAVVKLDSRTGAVLALCGGRDYQESPYNRATRTKRDLGHLYEPFLYAFAHERSKVGIIGKPLQMGRQLGVDEVIRLSKRVGFSGPFLKTEDLYRGSVAVSVMELATAASSLVNEGARREPFFIGKITNEKGDVLYENKVYHLQVIRREKAKEVVKIYQGVKADSSKVTTTTPCRNVWGLKTESKVVTGLWLGCDKPKRIGENDKVVKATKALLKKL